MTANPSQGDSMVVLDVVMTDPTASDWSSRVPALLGRCAANVWSGVHGMAPSPFSTTRSRPSTAAIPAAECRTTAPMPHARAVAAARYNGTPRRIRRSSARVRSIDIPVASNHRALPAQASATPTIEAATTVPTVMRTLAPSTGRRVGAATSVARIWPEPYSAVTVSTPSVQNTSWASATPEVT